MGVIPIEIKTQSLKYILHIIIVDLGVQVTACMLKESCGLNGN